MDQNQRYSQYPSTFYRVSLKAVIRNNKGEVLMAKEGGQLNWSLPGGGWDHGETAKDCLLRELNEEVAFEGDIEIKQLATTFEPVYLSSKQAWLLWQVYEVIPSNMDFGLGEDADEVAFVDPSILKDGSTWEPQATYRLLLENNLLA